MPMENNKNSIDAAQDRKRFDAQAKILLSHKEVIANILKYAVKEFSDCSLPEIISCLNGNPEVGIETVDDDYPSRMDVAGSETVSSVEGMRTFDIKFKVRTPDNEEAELIINIESQNKYYPGYTLEKRGIYYLSRMISSQYNVEFTKSNFDKLKKVYSIWICTHSPVEIANTITSYSFKPENIVGSVPDVPHKYDLMTLIMINLGVHDKNYTGLIKMLDTLLNGILKDKTNALKILENEFQIPLITMQEEADTMCNLSEGVFEEAYEKGIKDGIEKATISKAVEVVNALVESGANLDFALKIANIDQQTYDEYMAN